MKASDLRAKTPDELRTELVNLRKESFNMRFQKANGQLDKVSRVREVRRDIARVQTILAQKKKAG